jgi:hypothetical protein
LKQHRFQEGIFSFFICSVALFGSFQGLNHYCKDQLQTLPILLYRNYQVQSKGVIQDQRFATLDHQYTITPQPKLDREAFLTFYAGDGMPITRAHSRSGNLSGHSEGKRRTLSDVTASPA